MHGNGGVHLSQSFQTAPNTRGVLRDSGVFSRSAPQQWKWFVGPDCVTHANEIRTFTGLETLQHAIFLVRNPPSYVQRAAVDGQTVDRGAICPQITALTSLRWSDAFSHSVQKPLSDHRGLSGSMTLCCLLLLLLQDKTVCSYGMVCFQKPKVSLASWRLLQLLL